jgi:hypothetical protein
MMTSRAPGDTCHAEPDRKAGASGARLSRWAPPGAELTPC